MSSAVMAHLPQLGRPDAPPRLPANGRGRSTRFATTSSLTVGGWSSAPPYLRVLRRPLEPKMGLRDGLEAPAEHGDSHSRVERMASRPRASAHRPVSYTHLTLPTN